MLLFMLYFFLEIVVYFHCLYIFAITKIKQCALQNCNVCWRTQRMVNFSDFSIVVFPAQNLAIKFNWLCFVMFGKCSNYGYMARVFNSFLFNSRECIWVGRHFLCFLEHNSVRLARSCIAVCATYHCTK